MRKRWIKPYIEVVSLMFDKDMDTACHVAYPSGATPSSGACNQCYASECWSNKHGTWSHGPCGGNG